MKYNDITNDNIEDLLDSKVREGTTTRNEDDLYDDINYKGSERAFNSGTHKRTIESLKYQYLRAE